MRLFLALCLALPRLCLAHDWGVTSEGPGWTYRRLGNAEDVSPPTQRGIAFAGGNKDPNRVSATPAVPGSSRPNNPIT